VLKFPGGGMPPEPVEKLMGFTHYMVMLVNTATGVAKILDLPLTQLTH